MKKLALGVVFFVAALAACGGSKRPQLLTDSNDGDSGSGVCDPLMQTGCNTNEKCTWVVDIDGVPGQSDPVGHIGCVTLTGAEVARDADCMTNMAAQGGADNCSKGDICVATKCKAVCDFNKAAGAQGCPGMHSCTRYANLFVVSGMIAFGACDPQCETLTQKQIAGSMLDNCGTDAVRPTQTCISTDVFKTFSCVRLPMDAQGRKDRDKPLSNLAGQPFGNGCEVGYVLGIAEMTGSMQRICQGVCKPAPMSASDPQINTLGDATAMGKIVGQAAARVGDATCAGDRKGSVLAGPQNCIYLWGFLISQGMVLPSPFHNSLGLCFSFQQYMADIDGDGMATDPVPDCHSLVAGEGDPNSTVDGTADWAGCEALVEKPGAVRKLPAHLRDIRIETPPAMQ